MHLSQKSIEIFSLSHFLGFLINQFTVFNRSQFGRRRKTITVNQNTPNVVERGRHFCQVDLRFAKKQGKKTEKYIFFERMIAKLKCVLESVDPTNYLALYCKSLLTKQMQF